MNSGPENRRLGAGRLRWLPPAVAVLAAAFAFQSWRWLEQQQSEQLRHRIEMESDNIAVSVQARMKPISLAITRLANRWPSGRDGPDEAWKRDARQYLADDPAYLAITWRDDQGSTRWIASNGDAEVQEKLETVGSFAPDARFVSQVAEAPAGERFWLFSVRLTDEGRPGGYLIGILDADRLLEPVVAHEAEIGLAIETVVNGQPLFRMLAENAISSYPWMSRTLNIPGGAIAVRVAPTADYVEETESELPAAILASGLLASLIMLLAGHYALKYRRVMLSHQESNEALEREILEREVAENRFRSLVEFAPDAMVITEEDGTIQLINRQAEALFGYHRDEIVGHPVEKLIPESYVARHKRFREAYHKNPSTRPMARGQGLTALRQDGTELPVEISLSPLATHQGLVVVASVRDVSERRETAGRLRELNEQLQRSNADLEQFAYIASHDLQEPLRAVSGCLSILGENHRDSLDDEALELMDHAIQGAKRMSALIDGLLAYSRITTRGQRFDKIRCREAVEKALEDLTVARRETGAEINIGHLPNELYADEFQFQQVMRNLVSNALKFHGNDKPRISIDSEEREEDVLFVVRDNGIGIDPTYADRVFQVFKRLHTRKEFPGTGIGLAICKKIIERHGGRIWLDSTPGEGTAFYFTLPARPIELADNATTTAKEARGEQP